MIEVKNNRIYFYNTNKRDIIPVDFQCVSAYLCPHCKKVITAYYAGKIVDLEPFCEDPSDKYHYILGTSNGGQYLLLEDPTGAGTPQGGIISPILANLTLDGIEKILADKYHKTRSGRIDSNQAAKYKVNFSRYADL